MHYENDYYKGVPALVVEILSQSTRSKDLIKKLDLYMSCDIREYWIVNPLNRELPFIFLKTKISAAVSLTKNPKSSNPTFLKDFPRSLTKFSNRPGMLFWKEVLTRGAIPVIRKCSQKEFDVIYSIINEERKHPQVCEGALPIQYLYFIFAGIGEEQRLTIFLNTKLADYVLGFF